jgi:nitrate reductase delta subunit
VVHQVAAWCLGYPDDAMYDRVSLMRRALDEQPSSESIAALHTFLGHVARTDRQELAQHYSDVFELSRKQTLYLSYWSAGDTRRRGEVLAAFKQRYRDCDYVVDLRGELPDYLPIVLEFAALADPTGGPELLADNRAALELIRFALLDKASPYSDVLTAVCATIPGPAPRDRAEALSMAAPAGQVETVGLEPYDPRLLPLSTVRPERRSAR